MAIRNTRLAKTIVISALLGATVASAQPPKRAPFVGKIKKQELRVEMNNDQAPGFYFIAPNLSPQIEQDDRYGHTLTGHLHWKIFGDQGSLEVGWTSSLYSDPVEILTDGTIFRDALVERQLDLIFRSLSKKNRWQTYAVRYHNQNFGGTFGGADGWQEGFHAFTSGMDTHQYRTHLREGYQNSLGIGIGRGMSFTRQAGEFNLATTAELLAYIATQRRTGVSLSGRTDATWEHNPRFGLYTAAELEGYLNGDYRAKAKAGLWHKARIFGTSFTVEAGPSLRYSNHDQWQTTSFQRNRKSPLRFDIGITLDF